MYVFVLNIIFSCRKMVKILVDFIVKLYQFPLLPYRWSKIPLRRNGNNYLTSNSELRRNGNKQTDFATTRCVIVSQTKHFERWCQTLL